MRYNFIVLKLLFCLVLTGYASEAFSAPEEFDVPNFDSDSSPCHVKIPVMAPWRQCTAAGCEMAAPTGSTLESIRLSFSCLPTSAPTGFENPPEYAKVKAIRSVNAKGLVSFIDGIDEPADERVRELNFCLYGKGHNFCGAAQTLRLKDGIKADSGPAVMLLIRSIELR